jgi:hypothetical protein
MNISINITYTSGTKVELVVPLEEPCKISPTFPSNAALDGETRNMYNMTFVTQDGKDWTVPPGLMKDLVIIYGEKTVEQELLKAHAWLEADPARRKTPRGMGRFLNGWLSRASSMVRTPIKTLLKRDSLMSTNGKQESW